MWQLFFYSILIYSWKTLQKNIVHSQPLISDGIHHHRAMGEVIMPVFVLIRPTETSGMGANWYAFFMLLVQCGLGLNPHTPFINADSLPMNMAITIISASDIHNTWGTQRPEDQKEFYFIKTLAIVDPSHHSYNTTTSLSRSQIYVQSAIMVDIWLTVHKNTGKMSRSFQISFSHWGYHAKESSLLICDS